MTFGELPLADLKTSEIVDLAESKELVHPRYNITPQLSIILYYVMIDVAVCRPPRCPNEIYDVMCRCHMHNQNERITFNQIVEEFSKEDILKLMGEKEIQLSGVH